MLLYVAAIHSSSLPCNIPLHEKIYLSALLLNSTKANSRLWSWLQCYHEHTSTRLLMHQKVPGPGPHASSTLVDGAESSSTAAVSVDTPVLRTLASPWYCQSFSVSCAGECGLAWHSPVQ